MCAQNPASVARSSAMLHTKASEHIVCAKCIVPISVLPCKQILLSSCEAGTYTKVHRSRQATMLFEIQNKRFLKEKADFIETIGQAVNFQINIMC